MPEVHVKPISDKAVTICDDNSCRPVAEKDLAQWLTPKDFSDYQAWRKVHPGALDKEEFKPSEPIRKKSESGFIDFSPVGGPATAAPELTREDVRRLTSEINGQRAGARSFNPDKNPAEFREAYVQTIARADQVSPDLLAKHSGKLACDLKATEAAQAEKLSHMPRKSGLGDFAPVVENASAIKALREELKESDYLAKTPARLRAELGVTILRQGEFEGDLGKKAVIEKAGLDILKSGIKLDPTLLTAGSPVYNELTRRRMSAGDIAGLADLARRGPAMTAADIRSRLLEAASPRPDTSVRPVEHRQKPEAVEQPKRTVYDGNQLNAAIAAAERYKLPLIAKVGYRGCPGCDNFDRETMPSLEERLRGKAIFVHVDQYKNRDASARIPVRGGGVPYTAVFAVEENNRLKLVGDATGYSGDRQWQGEVNRYLPAARRKMQEIWGN